MGDRTGRQGGPKDLRASHEGLTKLAGDLDAMRDHLDQQVKRMDAVVDRIEADWRGPAATAYREFHRAATEDAVRIREVMTHLARAVRLSRDGFTERELAVVEGMRQIHVDVGGEVDRLSTPNPDAARTSPPARPSSGLDAL
ncbi:WXG100 family type VII secretion target [Streptomyces fagopyri]|uniref:WXG100 family type VII secretion target n=1 Tax=Streptomyces fagopyri TaxID=2662397 RepID=UPI001885A468|nr:WXG100 family type VII secretion target [Streptomyces fagopyri]